MAPKKGRTKACDRKEARARLGHARANLTTAEVIGDETSIANLEGSYRSSLAHNAIHAAIAAADAISCVRNGERSNDSDHRRAAQLLAEVTDVPKGLVDRFREVLDLKPKAEYDSLDPTVAETKKALRVARQLVELASSIA